jgi:hypothetical protein
VTYESEININPTNLGKLKNWGERVFATACLRKGIRVTHQIPVGNSVIDFKVETRTGDERLVEVTCASRKSAEKDRRKKRQLENMVKSGLSHSLLCAENLMQIQRENRKH